MKRLLPTMLSLLVLLPSCTPMYAVGVKTSTEQYNVPLKTGLMVNWNTAIPLEEVTADTPDDAVVKFKECEWVGMDAVYVKRLGHANALRVCKESPDIIAASDGKSVATIFVIALGLSSFMSYFLLKSLSSLLPKAATPQELAPVR